MADPLAQHPELARPDGVVVDQAHPVQPASPVRRRVKSRVGDRVVQGHAVDGRDADCAGHGDDLRPCPVGERMVVADGGQAEVGAVIGEAEDELARRGAARRAISGSCAAAQPDSMRYADADAGRLAGLERLRVARAGR